jgi:hypothetical protein
VDILTGLYGKPSDLGARACLIIQLVTALIVILEELLQKGYSLCSGVSPFVTTDIYRASRGAERRMRTFLLELLVISAIV